MKQYLYIIPLFFLFLGIGNFYNFNEPNSNLNDTIVLTEQDSNQINYNNPYITNFKLEGIIDKRIWSIEQDTNGIMFFANSKGIIAFDGSEHNFIKTPGVPYILKKDPITKNIYVGCNNSIGLLKKENGIYKFEKLLKNRNKISDISKIFFNSENIYFYNESVIIKINRANKNNVTFIKSPGKNKYTGIFQINKEIYVKIGKLGFFKVRNNLISPSLYCKYNNNDEIITGISKNKNEVILSSTDSRLMLFDGESLNNFETDADGFFNENFIIDAIDLNESKFAVSTLLGGVLIIDKLSGKTTQIINYLTGLPDDEIYSMFVDNNNGLWLSHTYGLSRVDFTLGIENYSNYMGLDGKIISSIKLDTTLYVITTEGVFYLKKPKNKSELEVIVKETKVKKEKQSIELADPVGDTMEEEVDNQYENTEEQEEEKKQGFLKRWKKKIFNKKNRKKNENDEQNDNSEQNNSNENDEQNSDNENNNEITVDTTNNIQTDTINIDEPETYVEKTYTIKKESSDITFKFYYYFKKIEGIDNKCKEIVNYNNKLLIGTNTGLFEIENYKAKKIIKDKYITKISESQIPGKFYIASASGIEILEYKNNKHKIINVLSYEEIDDNIYSIVEDANNNLWLGGKGYAYFIAFNQNTDKVNIKTYELDANFLRNIIIKKIGNDIFYFLSNGIFKYDTKKDTIIINQEFDDQTSNSIYFISEQNNIIWYKETNKWIYEANKIFFSEQQIKYLNLFKNIRSIRNDLEDNLWIVDGYRSLFKILSDKNSINKQSKFDVFINKVFLDTNQISKSNIIIKHEQNTGLKIELFAPFFIKKDAVLYQYKIDGSMKEWSEWSPENEIIIHLKDGKYVLHVRAKNILGQISSEKTLKFTIKPPFWEATWFYALIFVGFVLISLLIMIISRQALKKRNRVLEEKVKERTQEVEAQNHELKAQRDEIQEHNSIISQQNEELEVQKQILENQNTIVVEKNKKINAQNREITDSINYASRIQIAVLPPVDILEKYFAQNFIINMPRDVVSGDFYWLKQQNNQLIITVADCTGHGVPGAFLSMLGNAFLSEIVSKKEDCDAKNILNSLREKVIQTLRQTDNSQRRDGMDMSLCIFDFEKQKIQIAGAYNPVFIIRNEGLMDISVDRMPIGYHRRKDSSFTSNSFDFQKEDLIYLFSDGIIDQFGGKYMRKFRKGNFKKLLLAVAEMNMKDQKELILQAYNQWKGDNTQLDDILVIGLKI